MDTFDLQHSELGLFIIMRSVHVADETTAKEKGKGQLSLIGYVAERLQNNLNITHWHQRGHVKF